MANEVKTYGRKPLTAELVTEAFARGIIGVAEVRAFTALLREQRLSGGAAGVAKGALQEFLSEMGEGDKAGSANGGGQH